MKRVHSQIRRTFPEIAGVANGALILRDKAFTNMDLETFQDVVRPKVDGTIYLSELFSENTLDFFIPFSSIVATMGNVGQSAYSAANCFMKSLVAQRRGRGLAGSVIDISRVLGVGYVERETKVQGKLTEKQIERIMNVTVPMSEWDLHQLFGEAMLAGRPYSGEKVDVITGIRTLTSDATNNVFWAANLKFSHFIRDLGDVVAGEDSKIARVAVKTQLLAAKDIEGMYKILKGMFNYPGSLSREIPVELSSRECQANYSRRPYRQAHLQSANFGQRSHSRDNALDRTRSGLTGGGRRPNMVHAGSRGRFASPKDPRRSIGCRFSR